MTIFLHVKRHCIKNQAKGTNKNANEHRRASTDYTFLSTVKASAKIECEINVCVWEGGGGEQ